MQVESVSILVKKYSSVIMSDQAFIPYATLEITFWFGKHC